MPLAVMSGHGKPWTQRAAGEQAGGSSEGNAMDERKKRGVRACGLPS